MRIVPLSFRTFHNVQAADLATSSDRDTINMADRTEGYLSVSTKPDIRLYYVVDGPLDGSRQTILLSNSLATTTHLWDELASFFSPTHTIIRYDLRFHGKSPISADADFDYGATTQSLEDYAADIIAILDHLSIDKVSLAIGQSIGGGAMLIAGAGHPSRFGHILVVGARPQPPGDAVTTYLSRVAYVQEHGTRAFAHEAVPRWFSEAWLKANPEKAAAVEEMVGGLSIEGFTAGVAALVKLDLWPVLRDIRDRDDGGRFSFVAGERDGDMPEDKRRMGEVAGSKVVLIPGAGHVPNIEQPERFRALVREARRSVNKERSP